LAVRVVRDHDLGFDVDVPDDLRALDPTVDSTAVQATAPCP
jgi:hypothetical protein